MHFRSWHAFEQPLDSLPPIRPNIEHYRARHVIEQSSNVVPGRDSSIHGADSEELESEFARSLVKDWPKVLH